DGQGEQGFRGIVVFDAPVMIESGNYKNMERMIVVVTDDATQMARLGGRDGTDEAENRRKIASQMPLAEKAKLADYVIDNSGTREATAERVRRGVPAPAPRRPAPAGPGSRPPPAARPRARQRLPRPSPPHATHTHPA